MLLFSATNQERPYEQAAPTQLNGEHAAGSVEIRSSREREPAGRGKGVHNWSWPITEI